MKKQLLLFVLMLLPLIASADVEINGIYYYLDSSTKRAKVKSNPNKYTGSVVLPESVSYDGTDYSVTEIGWYAFQECSGLTSVTIPNSVTKIGQYAFSDCSDLTSVTIPNSVTSIGARAFSNCSGLTSVNIPNSVTYIEGSTFYCSGLTSVNIPNSVTKIEGNAFYGCSGLTSVTIPNSVTSIGSFAFSDCSGLTSIIVENGNSNYDSRNNCNAIIETATNILLTGCRNTIIPNNVRLIQTSAFEGCSGLTSVIIPNSVTEIGITVFYGCNELTSVTIGSAVKEIWTKAFANCPNLKTVKCLAEDVPWTYNVFADSNLQNATLYVPAGSIDAYKAKAPWNEFGTILTLDEETGIELPYSDHLTIQSDGGMLTVQGVDEGTKIGVYNINGTLAGEGISRNGCATVNTYLQPGSVAIIKIGDKSVKVAIK